MTRIIALAALLAGGPAAAADVALIGVIGDKAAVIAIDGGEPKTVKVGRSHAGVQVISVTGNRAEVRIDGERRVLMLGQHYRSADAAEAGRQRVTLAADARGHFVAEGFIDGQPVRFLVDTGATLIALPSAEAERIGVSWRNGRRVRMQTANGVADAHLVKLDRVRIGPIELHRVDAVVVEQPMPVTLLGMSFLNRVEMKRDGGSMTLIRRY